MNKTKKKIILAAIKLYNKFGFANVLNQDIAKSASISLSNFNYYFSTKQELVFSVCEYMVIDLKRRMSETSVLINKGRMALDIPKIYLEFEYDFKFFYLDTYNILQSYPVLKEEMYKQINESMQIIKNLNYLSVGMGYFKPEPEDFPGLYDKLVEQIWVNSHFWFAQNIIRGSKNDSIVEGLQNSYALIFPHLTEKGKMRYKEYMIKIKAEISN
ncbi:TetR/AcrR family transcriptional regulator [Polaribacter sp.]|uniref:TetR/AcrR family transcriptional regulator n=1 Tax=Polaribacter sp. TaxID=1920175 RepID=UPI0040472A1D